MVLLKSFDLFPAAIKVSTTGLQNILSFHKDGFSPDAASLIIRVMPDYTEILAIKGSKQFFSSVLAIPSDSVTTEVLISEISVLLSRYENLITRINRIYLTGDMDDSLMEQLRESVGDVETLDSGVQLESRSGKVKEQVLTAVGLAISAVGKSAGAKVNLIPHEKRILITRPNLIGTFLLAGLLIVMLIGVGTQGYVQNKALLKRTDAQIAFLQSQVDEVLRVRSQVEEKKEQLAEFQKMLKGRQTTLLILKDLTERMPDNTYLQNIQFQGDKITMQGYSDQISSLLPVLQDSPYFESMKTNWIQQDPRNKDKERFNLGATIKNETVTED